MAFKKLTDTEFEEIIAAIDQNYIRKCKVCNSKMHPRVGELRMFVCKEKFCTKRWNPVVGWHNTVFHKARIEKIQILKILEAWMNKSSLNNMVYMFNLSRKTIFKLLKRLRKSLVPKYYSSMSKIGGDNIIIEIDESKFGKRKYHKGHKVEGVWVLGMAERVPHRKVNLFVVDNRKQATLTKIIRSSVHESSTIKTDCWRAYIGLENYFSGHQTVNHSRFFKDPITGCHTNTIEGTWAGVKMCIPHRMRTKKDIPLFLVRYMLLRNEIIHPLRSLIKYLF